MSDPLAPSAARTGPTYNRTAPAPKTGVSSVLSGSTAPSNNAHEALTAFLGFANDAFERLSRKQEQGGDFEDAMQSAVTEAIREQVLSATKTGLQAIPFGKALV